MHSIIECYIKRNYGYGAQGIIAQVDAAKKYPTKPPRSWNHEQSLSFDNEDIPYMDEETQQGAAPAA